MRTEDWKEAVASHAREAAPEECCGLLLGTDGEVLEAVRARNVAEDRLTRFLIDPKDHIDARRAARARGLEVVGFYHSHPHSAAEPSPTDVADCSYPDHLHAIVSLKAEPATVALFLFTNGKFHRTSLFMAPKK